MKETVPKMKEAKMLPCHALLLHAKKLRCIYHHSISANKLSLTGVGLSLDEVKNA